MLTVVTAPTTNDLTTLETAQRELQLGQTALTGVPELITQASMMCAAFCGRVSEANVSEFGAQTVAETFREAYRERLLLQRDLNPAVTTVVEDGVTLTAADYERDGAILYRLSSDTRIRWSARKVVVTYTTGYSLLTGLPPPIEKACLLVLRTLIEDRSRDPRVKSERVEGVVAFSYVDPPSGAVGLPMQAAELLMPWRRVTL